MRQIINTQNSPAAIGPYSQAVRVDNTLYVSGQLPLDPVSNKIVQGDIREQTEQVLKNIVAILKEADFELDDVVKCTCLLSSLDDFAKMNEVYGSFFQQSYPARVSYEVSKLPLGALIEIEIIAAK